MRRIAVVVALVCATATFSTGSADAAQKTTVAKWVHGICTNLVSWKDDLQTKSQDFQNTISSSTRLADVKTSFVQFLDDAVSSTQSMLSDVKALGVPDVKDGAGIAGVIGTGLSEVQSGFRRALTSARALPTNPTAFQADVKKITNKLDASSNRAGKVFDSAKKKYDTKAIDSAKKKDPDCNGLN